MMKKRSLCDILFNELLYQYGFLPMRVRDENKLQKIMGHASRA